MQPKSIALIVGAAILGASALYAINPFGASATVTSSGVIVGREATDTKLELTVLPNNGADAYGVRVIPGCFDAVGNGDPWPNSIPSCR